MFSDRYQYNIRINNLDIPKSKLYNTILIEHNIDFISARILCDRRSSEIVDLGNYNRDVIFYFMSIEDVIQAKLVLL